MITRFLLAAILSLWLTSSAWAGFGEGLAAYESGDYATALEEWLPIAEQGDARAQYNLGVMYDNGGGVPQDYAKAMKWYRLAAEQGYARAQYNLGLMYEYGEGVPQDDAEAVKWYSLAAEQGEADAQANLGWMFYNGEGVQQDYVAAAELYSKAAEQGNAAALRNIIKMYENGIGVTQDDEVAEMYRSKLDNFSSWDVEGFERREVSTPSESYDDSKDDPEFSKWYREAIQSANCSYADGPFKFGLRIQWAVKNRDIEALFSLVPTELRYGPRKKFALKHSFSELFSEEWRERILSLGPICFAVPNIQFLAYGYIHYREIWKTNENNLFVSTNEWKIITIAGAVMDELGKTPISGGWVYKGKTLGSFCFSQNSWAGDGGNVPVDLSLCQKAITKPNVSIDEVGTVTDCQADIGRCLKTYYNLFVNIPIHNCKIIAPYISDNCIELGLVRISTDTGGSMGYNTAVTIYGIVKDSITNKVFMTPLVNFSSLNEALNFVDDLEK